MFVLGIDPGVTRCGYGVIDVGPAEPRAIAAGVLTTSPADPMPDRLAQLHDEIGKLYAEYAPECVVVERVFFQTNVRTAMSVGQASGIALALARGRGCEVVEYTANEVKSNLTGYGSAEKLQVQKMVQKLLKLPELPQPPDAADALALALCHGLVGARAKLVKAANS